jgi:uncharacterized OB-fold protein
MIRTSPEILADMARPDAEYRAGLAAGELRYQRCADCDRAVFYPRVVCPNCGGVELPFRVSSGLGTVYSTTTIRQRNDPSYTVSMVDMAEGFRILSTVQDMDPDAVAIGLAVRVAFDTDADGQPRVVFVPAVAS